MWSTDRSWETQVSELSIQAAFVAAYQQIQNPVKNARNDHFKNAYATLEQVLDQIKPVLESLGLVLVQEVASDEHGVGVHTYIENEAGDRKDFGVFTLPLAKKDPQGAGSAISYARRYVLKSIWALSEVDDDGNEGSRTPPPRDPKALFDAIIKEVNAHDTAANVRASLKADEDDKGEAMFALFKAMSATEQDLLLAVAKGTAESIT